MMRLRSSSRCSMKDMRSILSSSSSSGSVGAEGGGGGGGRRMSPVSVTTSTEGVVTTSASGDGTPGLSSSILSYVFCDVSRYRGLSSRIEDHHVLMDSGSLGWLTGCPEGCSALRSEE